MKKDFSNSAFPVVDAHPEGGVMAAGITTRDYFAAKAMQGLCADYGRVGCSTTEVIKPLAELSYKIADAMLAARNP